MCENGLVISTQDFANMRIRHYGYKFEDLKATITNIVEKLPLTVASMNKFKQIQLNKKQILKLAKEALNIRFGEVEMNSTQVTAALGLLKKCVPDIQAIQHSGDENNPLTVALIERKIVK